MDAEAPKTKCTVLVVEDEELMRDVVCESLQLDGHHCITAASMDEAQRVLEVDRPRVVLLDLHVAHASTEPLIEEIRRQRSEVVLFSASQHCKSIADRHGIDALPKPFDLDDLSAIIARLCATASRAKRT
jgi:DNA-binding NtrC family response regulator